MMKARLFVAALTLGFMYSSFVTFAYAANTTATVVGSKAATGQKVDEEKDVLVRAPHHRGALEDR